MLLLVNINYLTLGYYKLLLFILPWLFLVVLNHLNLRFLKVQIPRLINAISILVFKWLVVVIFYCIFTKG
jgi:hypothetical protein